MTFSQIFALYFLSRMDKYEIKIIKGFEHDSFSRDWVGKQNRVENESFSCV
jgi:hypothetical protein